MHSYATNARDREEVAIIIAVVAVMATLALGYLNTTLQLQIPWWVDTPSVMGFYGLFYKLYDTLLWRFKFGFIKLSSIPHVSGTWYGVVKSSYSEKLETPLVICIHQTWTRISIRAETANSRSFSTMAALNTDESPECGLKYEYLNEPSTFVVDTLHSHRGDAHLRISSNGDELAGDYFTGRGRRNIGEIRVRKIERKILSKDEAFKRGTVLSTN